MAATINYLSIDIVIGGYDLVLETDSDKQLVDLNDAVNTVQTQILKALQTGVAFKMEKGKVITINLGDFVDWVEQKILNATAPGSTLRTFFSTHSANTALSGIILDFWDLAISANYTPGSDLADPTTGTTKLSFNFCIKVELKPEFYNAIFGTTGATALAKIITLNSLGFGMSYSS